MWKFIIHKVGTVIHVSESIYDSMSEAQLAGDNHVLINNLEYSLVAVIPYM